MRIRLGGEGSLALSLLCHSCLLAVVATFAVPQYVVDYAPIIWLHPDDPFMPSDISEHLRHVMPWDGLDPIEDRPALDLYNLSTLNSYGPGVFLTSNEAINTTTAPTWVLGEIPNSKGELQNSTACAVVIVEHNPVDVDAFYFYFYSFNEGADIGQVVPPLEKLLPDAQLGDHYGNHVGDWEHNMIRFKDGNPTGIWYSQHAYGEACSWEDETCFLKDGNRPIVYSAKGSHANYPFPGSHIHDEALIDLAATGQVWDPVKPAYYYKYDPGSKRFTAADSSISPTDWLYFNGQWGDKQYPDSDPRQRTVRYFGLKKYTDGPNGPKFKHLVRKGVMPDHKPKDPLMKKLVRWYLSMYGCCLKGYNPWFVVVVTVLLLALMIGLIVFAVRKLRPQVQSWIERRGWFATRKQRISRLEQEDVQLGLLEPERGEDESRYRYPE